MKRKGRITVFKTGTKLAHVVWRKNKSIFAIAFFYMAAFAMGALLGILTSKMILDQVMNMHQEDIRKFLLLAGILFAGTALCEYISNDLSCRMQGKVTSVRLECLNDLLYKLMRCDYRYMEDASFWNTHQRAIAAPTGGETGIEFVVKESFFLLAEAALTILLVCMVGRQNFWIVLAVFCHIAGSLFVSGKVQKYQNSRAAEIGSKVRHLDYYKKTSENFQYGKDIRLYRLKDRILYHFKSEIVSYEGIIGAIARKKFLFGLVSMVTMLLSDCVTYGALILSALRGMSAANFVMYLSAVTVLSSMLKSVSGRISGIVKEGAAVKDYFAFMDTDFQEAKEIRAEVPEGAPEITLENLGFRYPNTDRYIFRNINLKIKPGESIALVGPNGAGKTTLIKVLTGLFDPAEGCVKINGKPTEGWEKASLYRMFSAVFQEIQILAFPLWINVALDEKGSRQRVEEILELVGLTEAVSGLPKGLDQPLLPVIEDDGVQLSGGEAQKVAIARALYKGGSIVILDEPTAALDPLAEAEIYEHFHQLTEGKTSVYISHRLASTRFCDKIAYFDGGCLKEYGTHSELMELHGLYYAMYREQSKYYQEDKEEL